MTIYTFPPCPPQECARRWNRLQKLAKYCAELVGRELWSEADEEMIQREAVRIVSEQSPEPAA